MAAHGGARRRVVRHGSARHGKAVSFGWPFSFALITKLSVGFQSMKTLLLILALTVGVSAQNIKEGKAITDWTPVSVAADISKRVDGTALDKDVSIEGSGRTEMSFAKVQRSENTFRGWMRFLLPSSAIVFRGKWNEIRVYVVCDCRKNEIKALKGIVYGVDGTIHAEENKQILEHTKPGSIGRDLFEFFCERGGPATVAPKLKAK